MKRFIFSFPPVSVISIIFIVLVGSQAYAGDQKVKDNKKENGTYRCTDRIDNDFDGLIDACDPDCTKNRNDRQLLKWAPCNSEDPPPTTDEDIPPVADEEPPFPRPDPYDWTPEGNLLRNPSGDSGLTWWWYPSYFYTDISDVTDVILINDNPAFYLFEDEDHLSIYPNGAQINQDVILPVDSAGKYLVLAGYVMTEGDSWDRPYTPSNLWSYYLDDRSMVQYPIRRADNNVNSCGLGCWQTQWGIHPIPEGIVSIRLFADIHWLEWDDREGVMGYFDDLEIRVFSTLEEAESFVQGYIMSHPEEVR